MQNKEASQKAKDRYLIEKVDSFAFRVPKGDKEHIQAHARAQGESTNAFIYRAVNEAIERDNAKNKSVYGAGEQQDCKERKTNQ